MSLVILVMDENGVGTLIKAGIPQGASIADTAITFATQIKAWKAPARTFRFLETLTRGDEPVPLTHRNTSQEPDPPLSTLQGECLYDTNSIFAYDGAQLDRKVALVFWKFALRPKPGDHGEGRLMLGAAMTAGDLYWEIVRPADPALGIPSFGSWSGSSEKRRLKR